MRHNGASCRKRRFAPHPCDTELSHLAHRAEANTYGSYQFPNMEAEIVVPDEIAVMALRDVAFFPQALLPLHIFEDRYRLMLKNVLATHRLLAVAGIDPRQGDQKFEPLHRIATVGIVRACQKNQNGTSNLLLQGLTRIEIVRTVQLHPFRRVHIKPLASIQGADESANKRLCASVGRLLSIRQQLKGDPANDLAQFLRTIEDPEIFVDIAAFNLCGDPAVKQTLLETLDVNRRLELFSRELRRDIAEIKLQKRLQGSLPDDAIGNN